MFTMYYHLRSVQAKMGQAFQRWPNNLSKNRNHSTMTVLLSGGKWRIQYMSWNMIKTEIYSAAPVSTDRNGSFASMPSDVWSNLVDWWYQSMPCQCHFMSTGRGEDPRRIEAGGPTNEINYYMNNNNKYTSIIKTSKLYVQTF